ncbi:E3 ubiquitin-protein ligase TOM1-like protein [Ceratocystis platani]|uniref:E3 ubiquitin-protein ligase TOM1-like protein n=1 Tax=Ceratocystis fimbriata f. sp. platani TaxID=88771 RepID=A0A0F8D4E5_CERFI|nr:E3 ubiquitin-protein ligase TOM1-like protein [Ceratocystis platani]
MGKITRTMQPKHRAALTPWLKNFVQEAVDTPLPLLPKKLNTFPTAWPFPRGDLYHWIPLLNRFDNILAAFTQAYKLNNGPQIEEFASELLSNKPKDLEYADSVSWDSERLAAEGYLHDGDRQLIEAVLRFTTMLLDRCGNRSIYASSTHLNELLHTTSLTILYETLQVGSKLAHRYQASVKRLGGSNNSRQISALLANHYNIDLNRVQLLTQAFPKTPLTLTENPVTPSAKGKEKAQAQLLDDAPHANSSPTELYYGFFDFNIQTISVEYRRNISSHHTKH